MTPAGEPVTLTLPSDLRLSPDQFAAVCAANPEAVLELDADGHLITMTPTGGDTSTRNQTLGALLWLAVRRSGLALKVFDSSGGFLLPDGSVRSPDASLVRLERWQALSGEQRRGFPPLCPDLVVELASPSDRAADLRRRMAAYQANGASLGWLLFPDEQAVEEWGPAGNGRRIEAAERLDAGTVFPRLDLELAEIWEG
ncbi:Uma2 family endonuclease [Synechococcus sp. Tobar12-5m-g]|nr:Uma2 family endonuclease [Synechococcus sp. Tobar12-5m-g]MCP9874217.1 Uma2 family endonuclease [Synechococcus sp. Cruz CV-v-12]